MTWRDAALAHAQAEFPREACGLVVATTEGEMYRVCRNLATEPDRFILAPDDYAAAEDAGVVLAVVHSHPNASAAPSPADRVFAERSGLPWHIVGLPSGVWAEYRPTGAPEPLLGRAFVHGVLDCYSLIRDGLSELHGVVIPDFERSDNWWRQGGDLYRQHYAEAGFTELAVGAALQPGDVLLMQIHSNVPNHAGLYLGDGAMLHHLARRLSCRETYGGYWLDHTTHRLRHRDLQQGASNGR